VKPTICSPCNTGVVITLLLLSAGSGVAPAQQQAKLFLFAGQSNMVGVGDRNTLTPAELAQNPSVQVYLAELGHAPPQALSVTRYWVPPVGFLTNYTPWSYTPGNAWNAMNPGHYDQVQNSYGPEFTACRDIAAALGQRIFMAKYALGGSGLDASFATISATWWPGAADPASPAEYTLSLYHSMLCWTTNALAAARQVDPAVEIAGFFWMQGEGDAYSTQTANLYRTNFTLLLQRMRSDLGRTNLPVVFGRISNSTHPLMTYRSIVRAAQAAVDGADTNAVMVNTDDLPLNVSDNIHYTDTSLKTLGQRFAQEWLNLNRPPSLVNSSGATNILTSSARLTGTLTATGGAPAQVTIFWGTANGGTNPTAWSNSISLGTQSTGDFGFTATNLAWGANYFYRSRAENSFGTSWSPGTAVFTTLPAGADWDGDGLADAWELSLLGSTNMPAGVDVDGDGASNLAEFVAGTSPTNATSNLRLAITLSQDSTRIEFQTLAAAGPGYEGRTRHYAIESCAGLSGPWQAVEGWSDVLADGTARTFTPTSNQQTAFYRLRVWLQ
jgi:hypothetical protein